MLKSYIFAAAAFAVPAAPAAAQAQGAAPQTIKKADLIARADAAFAADDTNKDGSLNAAEIQAEQSKELEQVRAQLAARIKAAFTQLDTNKDGQLSLQEFSASVPAIKINETPQQVLQKLDTNKDGKISAAEFRAPRVAAFDRADANKDGVVTMEEAQRAAAAQRK
ncbi:hypothetical protein GCM10022276_17170 [Sphingomonas limnosediminicola]|uniref:EF-hand domain-containing protein n=1 Tax=Sphingomonas limnosediminicola TaxID=940133 RepID=A0ABP7LFU2_9SPHN